MSGTSLDGLDIAYCEFGCREKSWFWQIHQTETVPYSQDVKNLILECENCDSETFAFNHVWLGHFFGKLTADFIYRHSLTPDFISSHGQTVFHQPKRQFTSQIADINAIAMETNCNVVGNFRSLDIALGGQGAPIVPIGDRILFSQYVCCLNLGGFANISFEENGKRIAYDICPVNTVLNKLANDLGLQYDKDGFFASKGKINNTLLNNLNSLSFYTLQGSKSLGKEWIINNIYPLFTQYYNLAIEDLLTTFCEHIAEQIAANIKGTTLVTGGGTYNSYLINRIKSKTNYEIIIPSNQIIDYKEALIFAFLGVLRLREEINILSSVTGATKDCCGGEIVIMK